MNKKSQEKELVDRFEDGGVFTPLEFVKVIEILLPYAEVDSLFSQTAPAQLDWVRNLDQNTILITLKLEGDILTPVATSGIGLSI